MSIQPTQSYINNNTLQTKNIVLVVKIAGIPDVFTSTQASFGSETYGDGSLYGDGQFYGFGTFSSVLSTGCQVRDYLALDKSSVTISQKLEPEQGRASVSQFTLAFIDKDSYITQLCSPGIIIPEIMGVEVTIYLGYANLTYPTDYLTIYRGYVSSVTSVAGLYQIQISDPNVKRRQQLFNSNTTTITSSMDNSQTTVPTSSNAGLYKNILGPNGAYNANVHTYIQIDSEIIEYVSPVGGSGLGSVIRGSLGTVADIHSSGANVSTLVSIQDTAMNLALQFMLSGWNNYWVNNIALLNLGYVNGVGISPSRIQLPNGVDAINDYGLFEGDTIAISSATNAGNDDVYVVVAILSVGGFTNNVLVLNLSGVPASFIMEINTPAVAGIRSQYDVLPVDCGLKLTPKDVDISGHIAIQQTWTSSPDVSYQFLINSAETSGKTFIESQVYLPIGCYSLTRRGQLSVGITKPPVGGAAVVTLNQDNVLNPESIKITRALNQRKFFNQIQVEYDLDLTTGSYLTTFIDFDTNSLNQVGYLNTLPIQSNGGRTAGGASPLPTGTYTFDTGNILVNQANLLLSRYKDAAQQVDLTTNYGAGNLIEAGDLVILQDNGQLQIANWLTGTRNLGAQYFEVENRSLDIKTGNVRLTLISGIGAAVTDRFGIVSPSSILSGTQTSYQIRISDSYGALYPSNEPKKWVNYVGQQVTVHSQDYSVTGTTTLVSMDPINNYLFNLSPALGFTPAAGYILDVPDYPTSNLTTTNAIYKSTFVFEDPQVAVTGGTSDTVFTVGGGDISKLFVGCEILIHNSDFSVLSGERTVIKIVGTTVTVSSSLGFTPIAGYLVELIGFSYDGGAAYRFV